jgi:hypothetical protein
MLLVVFALLLRMLREVLLTLVACPEGKSEKVDMK